MKYYELTITHGSVTRHPAKYRSGLLWESVVFIIISLTPIVFKVIKVHTLDGVFIISIYPTPLPLNFVED